MIFNKEVPQPTVFFPQWLNMSVDNSELLTLTDLVEHWKKLAVVCHQFATLARTQDKMML